MASFSFENTKSTAAVLLDLLPALLLAITFLQSGIDKIVDRAGNDAFFKSHFAKTPLGKFSSPMLTSLMIVEVLAGVLCLLGFLQILLGGGRTIAFWGSVVSAFILCGLLFGQRMAKDYVGAANLVPYFLVALFGIFTQQ